MACAPLNPAYRRDDFDFFLRDLAVRALVVADPEHAAAEAARGLDLPVLCLHRRSNVAGDCCIEPPAGSGVTGEMPKPAAGDVALLLHTSGTTARPKIVPLSQTNLCTSAANIGRTLNLQPADVCLNIMPLFHIHGLVAALLATVSSGASIVCSPGFNGAEFAAWLRDFGVTWYSAVPTMHQAILDVVRRQPLFEHKLRFVRSSSASLPPAVMHELAQRFAVPVIEAYGMTEAAHQMASNPLPPGAQKPGSVGLPAGPEVSVMNEQGELLTVPGSVGEIVIRGATVTAGYENNPQANAGAFVNGWFRTGDQGYRDSDGYIYLTGRIKELINRGGEKIAPREIEEVLLQHDAVAQAVAFALPHERLGEEVGAAVVLRSGQSIDAAELRRFAADRLPYFKVPRVLQVVDKIPLGPTGKLQRNALAQSLGITAGAAARSGGGSDPRSDLERRLAADWAELLELPRVGIDEDFFALGGDSLAATELILRYSEEWGADIPIADFVEQPTIGGLVALYERCRSSALPGRRAGLVTIAAGTAGPPIFCPAPHDDSLWRTSILVRQLAMQRPVYGFLAPRLGRRATPLTMEQLASRNIELMQAVQERGPYHLLGACFGGIVAYEMARQLERAGQQVALLAMIDSYNWKWRLSLPQQKIAAGPPAAPPSSGNGSAPHRAERWERFVERWSFVAQQRAFNALVRVSLPRPQRLQDARYGNSWALKRYVPGTYDGNVFLVRATVPAPRIDPVPQLGWSALMRGEVEMIDIDCDRDALWSHAQFLQEVPAALRRRLQVG